MPRRTSLAAVLLLASLGLVAACGGGDDGDDDGATAPDAAPAADAFASTCGNPGDVGNEVGVGKFCETLTDCIGNLDAQLCSNLGDATTFFCTRTCTEGDSSVCGAGAECTCGNGGCGCTPTVCLQ